MIFEASVERLEAQLFIAKSELLEMVLGRKA